MLRKGDVAAIDCEFVSTAAEESHISKDGRKVVDKDSTLALGRVSCLRSNGDAFIDDYIQKSEPILDYLTRFSGLIHGDLDAAISPHHLVSLKTSYLKLRWMVDNGIVFVGHGLSKDFRMINMHVPDNQIIDTGNVLRLFSKFSNFFSNSNTNLFNFSNLSIFIGSSYRRIRTLR